MLTLPSSVRIYVAAEPVDLRRGFDGLAAATRQVIGAEPMICVRNEYVAADRDCAVCAHVLRQIGRGRRHIIFISARASEAPRP